MFIFKYLLAISVFCKKTPENHTLWHKSVKRRYTCNVPARRTGRIVHGTQSITTNTVLCFYKYFNTRTLFRLNSRRIITICDYLYHPPQKNIYSLKKNDRTVYIDTMQSHRDIDDRSLALARALVKKIDTDPQAGIAAARALCEKWMHRGSGCAVAQWMSILELPWKRIRAVLLDPSETGRQLRQSNPFCGILTPRERWKIYKRFSCHEAA